MNIFVSFAWDDKYIACKIKDDLEALGAEVFLADHSLETGDDIDQEIRGALEAADELVAIISPTTLTSTWVVGEISIARFRNIRFVPILNHVSPNELKAPFDRVLARPLSAIDAYFNEVKRRPQGATPVLPIQPATPSKALAASRLTFDVGDEVTISEKPTTPHEYPVLSEEMRQYLGQRSKILEIGPNDRDVDTYRLSVDRGDFYWAGRWLTRHEAE